MEKTAIVDKIQPPIDETVYWGKYKTIKESKMPNALTAIANSDKLNSSITELSGKFDALITQLNADWTSDDGTSFVSKINELNTQVKNIGNKVSSVLAGTAKTGYNNLNEQLDLLKKNYDDYSEAYSNYSRYYDNNKPNDKSSKYWDTVHIKPALSIDIPDQIVFNDELYNKDVGIFNHECYLKSRPFKRFADLSDDIKEKIDRIIETLQRLS